MRIASLIVLLLAAAPARSDAIELNEPSDAETLCAFGAPGATTLAVFDDVAFEGSGADRSMALPNVIDALGYRNYVAERARIVLQPHTVLVDAQAVGLLSYDPIEETLVVPVGGQVEFFGGAYGLALAGDPVLRFEMTPEDFLEVEALHAIGSLAFRIVFQLPALDDPGRTFCHAQLDGPTWIEAELLEAEIYEPHTNERRAHAETVAWVEAHARAGGDRAWYQDEGPHPTVDITRWEVVEGPGCDGDLATVLQLELEGRAIDCYLRGLARNGRLGGALVMQFDLHRDGTIYPGDVRIDVLDNSVVRDCVFNALEEIRLPRGHDAEKVSFRATFTFAVAD